MLQNKKVIKIFLLNFVESKMPLITRYTIILGTTKTKMLPVKLRYGISSKKHLDFRDIK